ncbi:fibronectin type III domain-containing protein [Campylobacter californiensis]|uniref:fibronectin type III domain-containing protein n=1 Tax=Campylobacter californiensis TaxID=1032243 RepID=UPI002AD47EA3|nr:hypothetical protein [Campylobacter sp. RM13119]
MKKFVLSLLMPLLAILLAGCASKVPTQQSASLPTITNLKTISDMTEIGFEWTPTNDENVAGYYLYRSNPNTPNASMQIVADIKDRFATHYVDTDLAPETTYSYQMRSYSQNAISPAGATVNATTKALLESVPFLQAIAGLPNRVKIIWRPHPDLRVVSYVVERSNASENKWRSVTTVKGRLNAEYIDTDVKSGRSYEYRILVKTSSGVTSKPSAVVKATTKELP